MKALRTVIGKFLPVGFLLLIASLGFNFTRREAVPSFTSAPSADLSHDVADRSRSLFGLYDDLQLGSLDLSRDAWQRALQGFQALQSAGQLVNAGVLTIIDFSLPSTQKRLFVIDLRNGRLLFNTLVAHGRNSGKVMATRFSNRCNSYMSSLGVYLTGQPFIGSHGYSLRLEGMEKGWNDHALERAIVMHPAPYVSERHIAEWGYLGRSEGCPAIPARLHKAIIDQIKGGSCLFIYAADEHYLDQADPFS
ncbi:MAG TPA: murein L,D-transpeptidase catalytic domain family protein [Puia sp.]|nr:murein L,D-transpeptidase catalytic domain family protein [Puia sp.]